MWLSSLFGNIASMRSFQLGIIMLCGLIFNNCGDVTIHQLGTKNLQNLQQIAVKTHLGAKVSSMAANCANCCILAVKRLKIMS